MNSKRKRSYPYRRYLYDVEVAIALNDDHYSTWLIMDEGMGKPYPQRYHNFLLKYGLNKKNKNNTVLHYLLHDYNYNHVWEKVIKPWIIATKSERKKMLKIDSKWCKCFNIYLHLAMKKFEEVNKLKV